MDKQYFSFQQLDYTKLLLVIAYKKMKEVPSVLEKKEYFCFQDIKNLREQIKKGSKINDYIKKEIFDVERSTNYNTTKKHNENYHIVNSGVEEINRYPRREIHCSRKGNGNHNRSHSRLSDRQTQYLEREFYDGLEENKRKKFPRKQLTKEITLDDKKFAVQILNNERIIQERTDTSKEIQASGIITTTDDDIKTLDKKEGEFELFEDSNLSSSNDDVDQALTTKSHVFASINVPQEINELGLVSLAKEMSQVKMYTFDITTRELLIEFMNNRNLNSFISCREMRFVECKTF
ncbi:hypothetical protein EDI_246320 [Entamoeba dispar SAW760]|uniref:Uncharacterized protein n=1 Tax=Entamoeba dispar (strain ATCC PRA-260 / SAW760) TaxID=370354 RepID=B0EEP0_ENTDS|nr:uncharacterized protein EDI_246320 [Entamoeba dispar SAW760]EDR27016.1 hypothetical protein EDI_246320 [Entamoeba dispar SAW760]|eukprot:EDR27016.1 hypothetical protein EDI_246320 [Entamoeba dispar SAW760]